jgi:hypothetical protein
MAEINLIERRRQRPSPPISCDTGGRVMNVRRLLKGGELGVEKQDLFGEGAGFSAFAGTAKAAANEGNPGL